MGRGSQPNDAYSPMYYSLWVFIVSIDRSLIHK